MLNVDVDWVLEARFKELRVVSTSVSVKFIVISNVITASVRCSLMLSIF